LADRRPVSLVRQEGPHWPLFFLTSLERGSCAISPKESSRKRSWPTTSQFPLCPRNTRWPQIKRPLQTYGSADIPVSIISALADKIPSQDVLAVMHRLYALANTMADGEGKAWRTDLENQDYTLLDEALFRAAARAPLMEAETMAEMKFDLKQFLDIALEESKPEGRS
jgi:hypothetical protein